MFYNLTLIQITILAIYPFLKSINTRQVISHFCINQDAIIIAMEEQKETLSERELGILRLVATGASNKEIARQLYISPNTVKVHLRNIFTKINVASRTEATLYAINLGLVKPGQDVIPLNEFTTDDQNAKTDNNLTELGPAIIIEDSNTLPRPSQKYRLIGFGGILVLVMIVFGLFRVNQNNQIKILITPTSFPQPLSPNLVTKRWTVQTSMPAPRKGMGSIEYNDLFYIFGGETSQGVDGKLLLYDPLKNTWKTLQDKPTPVTDIHAVLLGEKIYIPGGRMKNGLETDTLEVYDPRQDSWETKASMPTALSAYAIAAFEGRLYLFGGISNGKFSSEVFSYDPQEDQWQERSPLDVPRAYAGAAALNGKILIIGGFDGKNPLQLNQAYFPNREANGENAWENYQALLDKRYAMGVTQLAGIVFLIGGIGEDQKSVDSTLQYNSPTDQWVALDTPPLSVGAHNAILTSGNFVYICGGESAGTLLANNQAYQAIYTISVPVIGN